MCMKEPNVLDESCSVVLCSFSLRSVLFSQCGFSMVSLGRFVFIIAEKSPKSCPVGLQKSLKKHKIILVQKYQNRDPS